MMKVSVIVTNSRCRSLTEIDKLDFVLAGPFDKFLVQQLQRRIGDFESGVIDGQVKPFIGQRVVHQDITDDVPFFHFDDGVTAKTDRLGLFVDVDDVDGDLLGQ